jgi:outer membrane protein
MPQVTTPSSTALVQTMKRLLPTCLIAFILNVAGGAAALAQQAPRRLTFQQAVQVALENGPEIEIGQAGIEASEARVRAAGAQRFPGLSAAANIQYWNKPLDVAFVMPGMMTMQPAEPIPALRVRDQVTSQVTITLAQPISGLLALQKLMVLEQNGVDAARADKLRARLDTAQRAAEAYLRVLQAQALAEVASKSVAQVEVQLHMAQVSEKAGALGQVDVLRLTAARDTAREALLRARTGISVARAALVLALELPAGTALELVDDLPDPPPPLSMTEQQVVAAATRDRPELVAAHERTEQARAGTGVAKAALLPNIVALGTYQHTEGQATFQPKDAWFVGGTLTWDLWDWGKNWNGIKEAKARARQAEIGERALRDQVAFDAQRRLLEARNAHDTLAVARSGQQAAEEAHRIQTVRYREGAATTTDVIDAEAGVLRARVSYTNARYDYYLAQAAVARAVGRLPSTKLGGPDEAR